MDPTSQQDSSPNPVWEQLAPVLDEALAQLSEKDRDALVLRFFKDKPLREVGQELGIDQGAAQKRVARAVDKLRRILQRRGAVFPAVAITAILAANAVQAAPPAWPPR